MLLSRRTLLIAASLAAAPTPAWARNLSAGAFTHGVASGDPSDSAVILWTRFAPAAGADGRIGWEVADDENFARVVKRGALRATAASDYCVKVDVRGLQPGRPYFYRFLAGADPSVTGRTRTAPRGPVESLNAAFFSCSNLPFGYFHAYADAAAREDIELCLHLGDYIYEPGRGAYPSAEEAVAGRIIEPDHEIVSLADYYARYGSYHLDPDLQELRRLKPLSVVWDDHETTNDSYKDGAQNHQPETEGTWLDRLAAASKAYFDWMPIRRPDPRSVRLYRTIDWGDLARIVLLDTRIIGRDKQINYMAELAPQLMAAGADAPAIAQRFRAERLMDANRSLMGATQETWLAAQLGESKARGQTWQVLAQQLEVGELRAPAGITRLLPEAARQGNSFFTLAERLNAMGLPFNTDSWSGYPPARERMLAACTQHAANALVIGGDTHNCWVNNLKSEGQSGRLAAVEFAGGSVTSPGFERTLSNAAPGRREVLMMGANADMAFCDLTNRGYGALTLTKERCAAEWRAVSDIRTRERGPTFATPFVSEASAAAGPGAWAVG
jgi:alkaline phosphatase D